ncbi:hypothetical protein Droror1_Dr00008030 [Drosera rotundifolia]
MSCFKKCCSGGDDNHVIREYSFASIQQATDGFSDKFFLREGSFGRVYIAKRPNDKFVAVRILPDDPRPEEEFKTEVNRLLELDHPNLVKLTDYLIEGVKRLFVYEFTPFVKNYSLGHCLHGRKKTPLDWNTRIKTLVLLKVCSTFTTKTRLLFMESSTRPTYCWMMTSIQSSLSSALQA